MFAELGSQQLTHELLVMLMAEVITIVNARPISAIPTDLDEPQPLSPSMLLTMKTGPLGPLPVPPDVDAEHRWRSVHYLTDQFWIRWRREYFQGMQTRTKWEKPKRNLRTEDVVLIKEEGAYRNEWPIGRVSEAIVSDDRQVRKVQVKIVRGSMMKCSYAQLRRLSFWFRTNREPQVVPLDTDSASGLSRRRQKQGLGILECHVIRKKMTF